VWIAAAVTALLFTIGKFLIGLYIGKSGLTSVFGAAGSLVVRAGVGVLLRPDISDGRGIHLGLCAYNSDRAQSSRCPLNRRRSQPDYKKAA